MKILLIVASLLFPAVAKAQPISFFVTSAGASNSFTDPNKDNADTLKDLAGHLKN